MKALGISVNSKKSVYQFINLISLMLLLFLFGCGGGGGYDDDSPTDTTAPVITIHGDNPATVAQNATYTDAGASANDNVDGSVAVTSSGTVNTAIIGIYTITYTASDYANNRSTATRTVNVVDLTPPVITVSGDNPTSVAQNTPYIDAGATATDSVDGTVSVTTSGTVDTAMLGVYVLTYSATDAAANLATATRTVNVVDVTPPVITVLGEDPVSVIQNDSYTDAGATALDDTDGNVTVLTTGSVDTSTVGAYTLTYTASDTAGNQSTATRTVNVETARLSGVAAAGAAIVGTVTIKDSLGATKSSLIEANGNYNIDVTGMTAPYRIRAQGSVGGKTYRIYSYAEAGDLGNTINITPFTDLIIANAAAQIAESFFNSDLMTSLDSALVAAQEAALRAKLQAVFDALGLDSAINLLRTAFNTDHSGLDAALDLILIGTAEDNIVTITNLLDGSFITDDISDPNDNDAVIVINPEAVAESVTETQAIANLFTTITNAFANGLPNPTDIENLFTPDFLENDNSLGEFLTEITTDPTLVGLAFASVAISALDSSSGTAMVSFHPISLGEIHFKSEKWFVLKDEVLGWQLHGDQRIVHIDSFFHCNSSYTNGQLNGQCGINTSVRDENFANNATNDMPISSATVKLISGSDGTTVKHIIYLGNPVNSTAGQLHIYNEGSESFDQQFRAFGSALGQVEHTIFVAGDFLEYNLYTQELDLSNPALPAVSTGSEIATYTDTFLYAPSITPLNPVATGETITAIADYTIGTELTIAWTLVDGTKSEEVYIQIYDSLGNRIEISDDSFASTVTSVTFSAAAFETAIQDNPDFDPNTPNYTVQITIFAMDISTGQEHSASYYTEVTSP